MIAIEHRDPELRRPSAAGVAETWLADAYDLVAIGWCQGASARDADGQPVAADGVPARAWSVTGALLRVLRTSEVDPELALHAFQRASLALTASVNEIPSVWNDAPRRTSDEALAALASAISLVREPVAGPVSDHET
jgi:hypothetical protein